MLNRYNKFLSKAFLLPNITNISKRFLNLHEYQSAGLINEFNVATPKFITIDKTNKSEFANLATSNSINLKDFVIKAQVLAGGRGLGHFDNGFKGGVHLVTSLNEAEEKIDKMLGAKLITKQTDKDGKICNKLMVCERV